MTDDIDDEFRRIVASQLADLDVASLDDLDLVEHQSPTPRDEPVVPARDEPPVQREPPARPQPPVRPAPP
ncbi:MAG TPA: hypothetical protein VLS51_06525, partial [Propionibacteriaceae bacterium]|nr:hypothetical protein [Propionibacteriaceae bacterium]